MARIGSEKDLMYVPTDLSVVREVAAACGGMNRHAAVYNGDGNAMRFLDPCAGEGEALSEFARAFKRNLRETLDREPAPIETWGFEIHQRRAAKAREKMKVCRHGDFLSGVVTSEKFHMVWANPPYGPDKGFKRLEHRFLARVTPLLSKDGLLVYIVPRLTARVSARFLASHYRNFRAWDPGHEDSAKYKQIVIMAYKASYKDEAAIQRDRIALEEFGSGKIEEIEAEPAYINGEAQSWNYMMPLPNDQRPWIFRAMKVDYAAMLDRMDDEAFSSTRAWTDITHPLKLERIRPLMPQLSGHMAQLLSANLTGDAGVPLMEKDQDGRYVFRVYTEKIATTKEDKERNKSVVQEKAQAHVSLLNLDTFEYEPEVDADDITFRYRKSLAEYLEREMPARYHPSRMERPDYSKYKRQPLKGNAQRLVIEGMTFALNDGEPSVIASCDMGTGKTYMSIVTADLAGKKRVLVLCPPSMVDKWRDEIKATIRGVHVYIVGERQQGELSKHPFYKLHGSKLRQLDWLKERYAGKNMDTPLYVVMAHSKGKMSFGRMPAVWWRWGYRPQPEIDEATGHKFWPAYEGFDLRVEAAGHEEDAEARRAAIAAMGKKPIWVKRMCCPECGSPIVDKDGVPREWEWVSKAWRTCAAELFVGSEKSGSGRAQKHAAITRVCGAPLWQAYTRNLTNSMDTGVGLRGQMQRQQRLKAAYAIDARPDNARDLGFPGGSYVPSAEALDQIKDLEKLGGNPPPRRYDLSEYIKRAMGGVFDLLIADEIHQFKANDTAQARLASVLAEVIPQRIALTGTIMSGFAKDLYMLLYHFGPKSVRRDFGHTAREMARWADTYGFVAEERAIERSDAATNRARGQRKVVYPLPGALPHVLRHFLPNAVFMRQRDVSDDLPPFKEHHISVKMSEDKNDSVDGVRSQRQSYIEGLETLFEKIKNLMWEGDGRAIASLRGKTANFGMVYPEIATNPDGGQVYIPALGEMVIDLPRLRPDKVYPKEQALLDIVKKRLSLGRRVMIYVAHTDTHDVIPRLEKILKDAGVFSKTLRAGTPEPSKRVARIKEWVEQGVEVVICQARLVEVGIDLLDFPDIVWYELSYSTVTVRQASRRSWRIGQTEPVNVYYLTYAESKQTQALHWISKKVEVSLAIEGDVTADGLAAMSGDSAYSMQRMLVESGLKFDDTFENKLIIGGDGDERNLEAEELVVTDADIWDLEAAELVNNLLSREEAAMDAASSVIDGEGRVLSDGYDLVADGDGRGVVLGEPDDSFASPIFTPEPDLDRDASGAVDLSVWADAFGLTEEEAIHGPASRRRR